MQQIRFQEIRIPLFEHTELFQRGVGDTTDIVQKEMYTFNDKGGRSITLRPEGTAGVVRSYIENGMASWPQPVKLFYNITAYRYENVQKAGIVNSTNWELSFWISGSRCGCRGDIPFISVFRVDWNQGAFSEPEQHRLPIMPSGL